ncbi:alpha/beta hydrolase [Nocardia acidivorans]|uniref:alpha/beta hydrolase n=1 Tax=Nocardia acidivorans TaxID=404580 RepID=UPI0012F9C1F5|nr:alpha/beta hydrolase [Nocardia acidivorans]
MGRATMSQVRGWHPEVAGVASDAVVEANRRFTDGMRAVARRMDAVVLGWRGAAATAGELRALAAQWSANHIGAAMVDIADALADASSLAQLCALVREIERDATANGCVIAEDGTVAAPRADTGSGVLDLVLQGCFDAKAAVLQARLLPLLDYAGETDQRVGARLAAAVEALISLRTDPYGARRDDRVTAILDGDAFLPEEPKALAALWDSLTPADQDALFAYDPAIGDRDGLPAVARDFYNRADLDRLRATATTDLNTLNAQHPDWVRERNFPDTAHDWRTLGRWDDERTRTRTRLADYAATTAALAPPESGLPPRFLLTVDNRGHGAIALNNPDTAANIATFVPGTGSPLAGIGAGVGRARALLDAATKADRTARTSVIAWYGYDTPPALGSALRDRYADDGAPALNEFQSGLRATHDALPARNTVIGHSYGSTLIGVAAGHGNSLAADNVIFVGSPGVEVDRATELRLDGIDPAHNREHVFATADPADPIPKFGHFIHGVDPADPDFGATVFGSAGATLNLPLLRELPIDPWAHGNYWDTSNPALRTQGEIIAGRYRP